MQSLEEQILFEVIVGFFVEVSQSPWPLLNLCSRIRTYSMEIARRASTVLVLAHQCNLKKIMLGA